MQWYVKVLKQYADFNGRARRTEFWMFVLISILISIALSIVDAAIGTASFAADGTSFSFSTGLLGGLYGLAVLIPSTAVTVRRLHDTDRSGWWALLYLVPLVGVIVLIVFACIEGIRGPNRFGMDPKQTVVAASQPGDPAMPV